MTGITLGIGWLGTISLFLAPTFIIMNTVQYLGALGMPKVPADAKRPVLDNRVSEAVYPQMDSIISRLNLNENFDVIARDVSAKTGVTPGEVQLYARQFIRNQMKAAGPARTQAGFDVVQKPATAPPTLPPQV